MSYLALVLAVASTVLARDDPRIPDAKSTSTDFPHVTPTHGTGVLRGPSTGPLSDGLPYPTATSSAATNNLPGESHNGAPNPLSPIVPDNHDTSHPDNVIPKTNHTLHYATGGNNGSSSQRKIQAQVQYDFQHPSVPLEYIDSVKNIQCPSDSEISFSFSNSAMFQQAVSSWPKSGSDFVLIDATEGCGKSNQRTFFHVDYYTTNKDDFSVQAKGRMLSGGDPTIVKGFNVDWQHGGSTVAANSSSPPATPTASLDRRNLLHPKVSASKSISVSVAPTATDTSPWGPSKKLGTVDGVTIFCTNCGANGGLALSGSITASLTKPHLRNGAVTFDATAFNIPMVFGFQAQDAELGHKSFTLPVLDVGLDPFSVPDVVVIGPYFSLGVNFGIALSASGNLEAGVTMTWPDAKADLDLTSTDGQGSSNSGFSPTVQKTWNVSDGQIAINGTLGVPISLGVGLNILNGEFSQNASITDTPQIELDTIFNTKGNQKREHPRELAVHKERALQCTNGVQEIVKFNDLVGLNVLNVWKTVLASWTTQVFSTCIPTSTSAAHSTGTAGSKTVPASTGAYTTSPAGNRTVPASTGLRTTKAAVTAA